MEFGGRPVNLPSARHEGPWVTNANSDSFPTAGGIALARAEDALEDMARALGDACIVRQVRGTATTGDTRRVPGVVLPRTVNQIQTIVQIANEHRVPLYPVSTGNNWGYGSALPVTDDCIVVKLSAMNRILAVDEELGLVRLEPGVTQEQLYRFLEERRLPFMVPVSGAGPACSILANALERGYGLTPGADHFAALIRLRAVLGDGQIYAGPFHGEERDGDHFDAGDAFKWGLGPHLDGLFAQSNLGIVTEGTIRLARRPECVELAVFELGSDDAFGDAVDAIRCILQQGGGAIGGINLMNRERVLAMVTRIGPDEAKADEAVPEHVLAKLAAQHGVKPWQGIATLYGPRNIVRETRSWMRKNLRGIATRTAFLSRNDVQWATRVLRTLRLMPNLQHRLARVEEAIKIAEGRPSEVALPLSTWRSPHVGNEPTRDPEAQDAGLIWCTPLVPMRRRDARAYAAFVREVCAHNAIDPLITFTTVSDHCFDSSIPILFNRRDPAHVARARACKEELLEGAWKRGWYPYRLGVHDMAWATEQSPAHFELLGALRERTDPNQILAPGRYARSVPRRSDVRDLRGPRD